MSAPERSADFEVVDFDLEQHERDRQMTLEELKVVREAMEAEGLRPGINEIRLGTDDVGIHIPPIVEQVTAEVTAPPPQPQVEIKVPSPVGPVKAQIEQGDTVASVGLMLLLTTGLAVQALLVMWGYFKLKHRYAVPKTAD